MRTAFICCLLVIALVVLLALVLARAMWGGAPEEFRRGAPRAARGGAEASPAAGGPPHTPHPMGKALYAYARSLGPQHAIGAHPLDRGRYEPLPPARVGGARFTTASDRAAQSPAPKKRWDEYETWEALQADEDARAAYFEQRAAALNNPDLDWAPVLAEMTPKLKENREYIGIASLDADGRTLRVVASEASPLQAGSLESETAFASVPGELVAKYASRPALFIFHTHPADPRGSPLPSSHDLSTAIYLGATSRFAGSAVISRYGALVHGLDWSAYKAINEASDWKLAALNLSHDVVAAHEAVRSWSNYTIADYLSFYPRHRLLMFVYPSPEMVGDTRRYSYLWNLETPIDHDLIAEHTKDIADWRALASKKQKNRFKKSAFSNELTGDTALGFD